MKNAADAAVRTLARFCYWVLGWLPIPERFEYPLSEWAYRVINPKPELAKEPYRSGPQQTQRE